MRPLALAVVIALATSAAAAEQGLTDEQRAALLANIPSGAFTKLSHVPGTRLLRLDGNMNKGCLISSDAVVFVGSKGAFSTNLVLRVLGADHVVVVDMSFDKTAAVLSQSGLQALPTTPTLPQMAPAMPPERVGP
jgi:hypothetical protein